MKLIYPILPEGRFKALTLSFDDGHIEDRRLTELFNQYGLHATFNLNSGTSGADRIPQSDYAALYAGHEIASHGVLHPGMTMTPLPLAAQQALEDRRTLEHLTQYPVRGFAYPFGENNDAVAAMLYLDFDRKPGEWIPNVNGDNKNLEAIAFLKKMNTAIFGEFPDALMIAEESTAFPGVTHPVDRGGLGFNLKWNMGWANDFYDYLATDPAFRRYHQHALNFPMMYAYSENYILPISHDEVVHGKCSFINKMFGTYEEKFRTFRAAMIYMMTFPGKKMLFMGTEYGQFREWDYSNSLEWFMLDYPVHHELREFVASLNRFYLEQPALWEQDFSEKGFRWIYADDADHNAVSYRRIARNGDELITVVSFSGETAKAYKLRVPAPGKYHVVFSSSFEFLDKEDMTATEEEDGNYLTFDLPALCGFILRRCDEDAVTA